MRTKKEIYQDKNESACYLRWRSNFSLFCHDVLGYTIKPFHQEWCDLLQSQQRLAISAPTSYGKSWIFGIAYPIWLSYFRHKSESLIVSKVVRGQSQTVLEKIKIMMMDNELLKDLIPDRKEFEFNKERMILSTGAKIYLSAYSANVRGTHVDYLFGDEVATYPDKSDDYIIWFRDFLSRVEGKGGQVAAVSTPVEPGDLITLLMNKKGWYSKVYAALLDKDGKPAVASYTKEKAFAIWTERHSFETLMRIRDEQGDEIFERNYQCDPRASVAKAIYNVKDITFGYDEKRDFTSKNYGGLVFMGCDFAMSEHKDADKDAFVVVERILDTVYIKYIEVPYRGVAMEEKVDIIEKIARVHQPYQILCDSSNIGKDVVKALIARGLPGVEVPFGPANRKKLLSTMKIVISNKNLVIPYNKENYETIKFAEELTLQLSGFKEEKSMKTRLPLLVSTSAHDDLAMALALAISGAMEQDVSGGGFASGNF
jgi:phage terminase large subunit-like protein